MHQPSPAPTCSPAPVGPGSPQSQTPPQSHAQSVRTVSLLHQRPTPAAPATAPNANNGIIHDQGNAQPDHQTTQPPPVHEIRKAIAKLTRRAISYSRRGLTCLCPQNLPFPLRLPLPLALLLLVFSVSTFISAVTHKAVDRTAVEKHQKIKGQSVLNPETLSSIAGLPPHLSPFSNDGLVSNHPDVILVRPAPHRFCLSLCRFVNQDNTQKPSFHCLSSSHQNDNDNIVRNEVLRPSPWRLLVCGSSVPRTFHPLATIVTVAFICPVDTTPAGPPHVRPENRAGSMEARS